MKTHEEKTALTEGIVSDLWEAKRKKKKQLLAAINKRITNTMRRIMYDLYYPDLLEELGTNTTYFLFDGIYPYGK